MVASISKVDPGKLPKRKQVPASTSRGDTVAEINLTFNFRPGPALRSELAHGKLPWNAFQTPETITGCWFIFALACMSVLPFWKDVISPAIQADL